MCGELRALHDRLGATTVYVTHDQLEAMSMGDKIAVMNDGAVEQLGSPREIYDRPASMFVADFIGSPPMNFVEFEAPLRQGDRCVVIDGAEIAVPELRETASQPECVLGVRPEHVRLSDTSPLRGSIYGAEYLGTTQIVTVATGRGFVKARLTSETAVRLGEPVGLAFRPEKLSIFDRRSGRVLRSALHDGGAHG
jgi:multiple sugar transport system ATP-binding protein